MFDQWPAYVPVAERRRLAAAEMAKLVKQGQTVSPVRITGRAIATTAWGKAWCDHMEGHSDFANRLPRGRTYVRNGSVVDLQIVPGKVEARVSGSSIYRTTITVKPLAAAAWKALCTDCAGGIDSLVELLQGRFAAGVMQRLCRQGDGLFPVGKELRFTCSCPDGAYMCKHVAAVLYGVGARFDHQPHLLFTLRKVDASALLARAGAGLAGGDVTSERTLVGDDISALFGLEMDAGDPAPEQSSAPVSVRAARTAVSRTGSAPVKSVVRAQRRDPASTLLAHLRKHGSLDNASARAATGLDAAAVRLVLQRLVIAGQARVEGRKRGTRYMAR
ncbi:MAG: SWIM zinc finger family protein [Planctomycetes bacterium]|nr:SWIM zinc finger family protein [Planctomycetota bacterium]